MKTITLCNNKSLLTVGSSIVVYNQLLDFKKHSEGKPNALLKFIRTAEGYLQDTLGLDIIEAEAIVNTVINGTKLEAVQLISDSEVALKQHSYE